MIPSKMRPLFANLLILRDAPETEVNGVLMPDTVTDKPSTGKVVAAGRLVQEVRVGDRVTLSQYLGTEFTEEGLTYLLAKESDVLIVHDPVEVCTTT